MFHAQRWAGTFLAVTGKDADEALFYLKTFAAQVKNINGALVGHDATVKLEKLLRDAFSAEVPPAAEYAIRFLCLLVEKNYFRQIDRLLPKIERDLDAQNGILNVDVEAAAPVDSGLNEELSRMIKEITGASGVKMKTCVRPELLGGYLLRIGSYYVDASLKGQLESMAAYLNSR